MVDDENEVDEEDSEEVLSPEFVRDPITPLQSLLLTDKNNRSAESPLLKTLGVIKPDPLPPIMLERCHQHIQHASKALRSL
jgi:hypothetical protein